MKVIGKKTLEAVEIITLLLALFDQFSLSLVSMFAAISILALDYFYKFIEKGKTFELMMKYFSYPVFLLAFYIIFGAYSINTLKATIVLAGYALIRVIHSYIK